MAARHALLSKDFRFQRLHHIQLLFPLVFLMFCLLQSLGLVAANAQRPVLLVSGLTSNNILRYDGTTGEFMDVLVKAGSGGLNGPHGMVIGHDGNLLVSSIRSNKVLRYDINTGEFLGVFAQEISLVWPHGLAFGPDGDLYVAGFYSDRFYRFNGTTGLFVDYVGSYLGYPVGIGFGNDSLLYFALYSGLVIRYDPATGFMTENFPGNGPIESPVDLKFGPDGCLYVTSRFFNSVYRIDVATGQPMQEFVPGGSGGLDNPLGIEFGPDDNLYVCSYGNNSILRYNGTTGAFMDIFIPSGSGGVDGPQMLLFHTVAAASTPTPSPSPTVTPTPTKTPDPSSVRDAVKKYR